MLSPRRRSPIFRLYYCNYRFPRGYDARYTNSLHFTDSVTSAAQPAQPAQPAVFGARVGRFLPRGPRHQGPRVRQPRVVVGRREPVRPGRKGGRWCVCRVAGAASRRVVFAELAARDVRGPHRRGGWLDPARVLAAGGGGGRDIFGARRGRVGARRLADGTVRGQCR